MSSKQKKPQAGNYFVRKSPRGFEVVEKPTDLIVKICGDHVTATKYKVFLNKFRAGFQGFTPPFFAEKGA